jgi:uncharacterized protein DUF4149
MRGIAGALESIALTLWVGAMWAVGFIVAPVLFARLSDRALAGLLAGKLFTLISYIGIACAAYLLLYRLFRHGTVALRQLGFWVILLMLILVFAGEFAVQPILESLKLQALPREVMESVFRARFNTWHGVSSALYVIESLLGAVLVVLTGRGR